MKHNGVWRRSPRKYFKICVKAYMVITFSLPFRQKIFGGTNSNFILANKIGGGGNVPPCPTDLAPMVATYYKLH